MSPIRPVCPECRKPYPFGDPRSMTRAACFDCEERRSMRVLAPGPPTTEHPCGPPWPSPTLVPGHHVTVTNSQGAPPRRGWVASMSSDRTVILVHFEDTAQELDFFWDYPRHAGYGSGDQKVVLDADATPTDPP